MSTTLPKYRIPTYQFNGRLFSRQDILDMLIDQQWGPVNMGDVDAYLRRHFWDASGGTGRLVPTETIPFPPIVLSEDLDEKQRAWALNAHEEKRRLTRKSRERFRLDGLPAYIPSIALPSANDPAHVQAEKVRKIEGIR